MPRAHGATGAVSSVDEFAGELQAYSEKLEALPPPPAACRAPYSKIDANIPLTISVFFGFIDTGRKNYVADGDFKQALIRQLTQVCRGQLRACGFAASAGDPAAPNQTKLLKSQDGRNVVIDVYDSSVSSDYSASVARSAQQEAKSRLTEEEYLAALKRDAVVLYAGHTRRFCDTGFYPPLAFSKTSAATFLRRPFFSRVYDTLRQSASTPVVLGLFACRTSQYYAGRIHALAPGTALIVSSDTSPHENNLMGVLGAINLVLARPCYGEVFQSINAGAAPVFHIYGLFDQSPHPHYTRYQDGRLVVIGLLIIPFLVLLVSGRAPSAAASWPAGAPNGAWSGAVLVMLLVVPCTLVARALTTDESTALPLLLALLGSLTLAIAVGKARISWGQLTAATSQAWPPLLVFLLLYFCSNLFREASLDNAFSALRQVATFLLVFFLIWPFVLFSEEALLAPFVGDDAPGFIASCIPTLVFYLALWLSLCALAPVYKPKLWPIMALALYIRTSSFLLYRRKPRLLIPAISLAMIMALLISEGIHALIYN